MDIELPDYVASVLTTLRTNGHTSWLVGGAVRDSILGQEPKDYDVATDADPKQVQSYFDRTVPVGAEFGVILVIIDSKPVEVATFRADGKYLDSRHPVDVKYSGPEEDAKRRDFTINGLFWDQETKEVIDYVSGMEDVNDRIIRTIGRASHRFQEDALRTVRAVRFLAQLNDYNFILDENLDQGIRRQGHLILEVSRERISEEIQKILKSPKPSVAFEKMRSSKLFERVFPDFRNMTDDSFNEMKQTLDALFSAWENVCEYERCYTNALLWASLFHFYPGDIKDLKSQNSVNLTRVELKEIKKIHAINAEFPKVTSYPLSRQKRILAEPQFLPAACLYKASHRDGRSERLVDSILAKRKKLSESGRLNPSPLITGNDLKKMGFEPGPEMGQILFKIRELQLDETISSKEDALTQAKELILEHQQA